MKDDIAYYEVKWKGYSETTLEPREVLLKDVPQMVNQFEKKEKITFYENTNKSTGEKNPAVSHVEIVFFMFKIQYISGILYSMVSVLQGWFCKCIVSEGHLGTQRHRFFKVFL